MMCTFRYWATCCVVGSLIVQRRDEATERAERQSSQRAESGACVWIRLEDSKHKQYTVVSGGAANLRYLKQ